MALITYQKEKKKKKKGNMALIAVCVWNFRMLT